VGDAKYFVGGVLVLLFVVILVLLAAYYSAAVPVQIEVVENATHRIEVYTKPDPALMGKLATLFLNMAVAITVISLVIVGLAYLLED